MRRVWAGLESSGCVAMSIGDREAVGARARAQRGWLVVALVGPFLSIALGAVVLTAAPEPLGPLLGCLGLGLVLPAASLLAAGDAWKRWRALRRDLERAELEVFEGTLGVVVGVEPALARLRRDGSFGSDPERSHRVEILAASGFVHRVDGVPITRFLTPDVLEVAEARPAFPLPADAAPRERRVALTEVERAEVRARAAQLWRTPYLAFGAIGYVGLGAAMWATAGSEWLARYGLVYAIWAVGGLITVLRLARRFLTARRLERDAESGDAIEIIQPGADGAPHRAVLLPRSRLVWSVDGLPAEWRSTRS
ncbi:MAG: hypothetical protein KF901_31620 [Myxococcales bacterium]|nr:hypothetical protein [Myxococcales bacterium]